MLKGRVRLRPAGFGLRGLQQGRAAAHKRRFQNFIPFERFQIGLPLEKFRIIVPADRHYPVVPANTQK
jgi:hypothetical protein